MRPILTPTEMRACDERAIASGTPAHALMDRAGCAVARSALRLLGEIQPRPPTAPRIQILCGAGNNGGDGFVAARYLARAGAAVTIVLGAPTSKIAGNAALHWKKLEGLQIPLVTQPVGRADLTIDALAGTGLNGPLKEPGSRWATDQAWNGPVLAVDIPSGVDGATGEVAGSAITATRTVTFAALKVGLVFGAGPDHAGTVEVADIGIPVSPTDANWVAADESDLAAWIPERGRASHKWSTGSVLVVAGSRGMCGAGILTASTALRAGAGLVVLAVPEQTMASIEGHPDLTEVMTTAHDEVPARLGRFSAVAIGPGLGTSDAARALVHHLLAAAVVPVVLDADGLNVSSPADVVARAAPTVLTPHVGEFRRFSGEPADDPLNDVPRCAAAWRSIVLLKGSSTLIASPAGERAINLTGTPELATAGTGDVLAGIVAANLARGVDPWRAATAAAYVHGNAGAGARTARDVRDRV